MILKVKKSQKCYLPSIGIPIDYSGISTTFSTIAIRKSSIAGRRLRPEGVRQSEAEARILSKYIAIEQNRAMNSGDILGR